MNDIYNINSTENTLEVYMKYYVKNIMTGDVFCVHHRNKAIRLADNIDSLYNVVCTSIHKKNKNGKKIRKVMH